MEKKVIHYVHPTGFALSITASMIYTLCALIITLWPISSFQFFNNWFHGIDLTKIAVSPQITLGSFVIGLLEIIVIMYIIGMLYAWLYNKCVDHCKKHRWIQ
ncbi:hypothetical protein J4410_03055 [Candidatus Woesearchaeota archaeon]|nr:hypothetical protein [Candidatus Woesearchaeota archaeon]